MNQLLQQLLASLRSTSVGTRVLVLLVGVGLAGILGAAGLVANRPHYSIAFSGLTDHEVAEVNKALSEAAIAFQVSQPPAPFSVFVDEDARSRAYMAVYGAGALDKPLEGILTDGGVASVFHSAEERAQGARKREWQEMEKMLEELDFVVTARVRTSPSSGSPLLGAREKPPTASVALRISGDELTPAQAATVANLVSRGLGVDKRDLVVSDQNGNGLYDGESEADESVAVQELLDHQVEHDRRLSEAANALLEGVLGPNKARVTVSSEWDYDQSTLRTQSSEKGAIIEETKSTSEKPAGSYGNAAVAGLSSNTLDPDAPQNAPAGTQPVAASLEKTSQEEKRYAPSHSEEERVRVTPELRRLSVALFLDQSLPSNQKTALEEAVKAAVGFSEERDAFRSAVLPFAVPPAAEAPAEDVAETPAAPSRLVETLLQRGVEIASALVFLALLVKSLRGTRKPRTSAAAAGSPDAVASDDSGVDPEVLARVHVEELLRSDPARVSEILSRWAREEPVASKA
jgi:flagellar M-ring protein FliF